MALQETMDPHPEMNLHQKVLRLQEMMLVRVKNPLQRLLQMDRLREMLHLLGMLLMEEMRLLPQMLLHLPVLPPLMHQRLQHLHQHQHQRQHLSQQMLLHPHHHQ